MAEPEGGQWNVATKDDTVYVERVSEDSKLLFEDLLAPEEARELARLLTKHADSINESDVPEDDDSDDDDSEDDDAEDDEDSDDDDSDDTNKE
jgi:hypothetical protein